MVNVTLKSGTNQPERRGLRLPRRDELSATDFFVKKSRPAKPELSYNRPGFSLGGPVVFPASTMPQPHVLLRRGGVALRHVSRAATATVPTQAMRNGDFSELLAQGIHHLRSGDREQVGARVVRRRFPATSFPPSRINPIARSC